ncbi:MAG: UMP kinase [Chloroflexota bacterium]|nr:UMP kinase [Chloroflexota bacterium]
MRYQRVLVKLSGGAFAGDTEGSFDKAAVDHLADEIIALRDAGVQVAIMVGGGNIFRGRLAEQWNIERIEADNIGMMATVINSLILRGALTARGTSEVRVMTAIPMASITEPYIRLRAIKHLDKGYIVVFAAGTGQPFVTTDYPAVQRAIEIRAEVILAAKQGADGVYSADPGTDPTATRFRTISYAEVIRLGLSVMDQSAFILARDHNLPIHVFNANEPGAMHRACAGEPIGTYVSNDPQSR